MDNAAIVRDFYATWNPDHLADDIEWRMAEGYPSDGHYRGHKGVFEEWWPRHIALLPELKAYPEHFLDSGSAVVVIGTYAGRVTPSGAEAAVPFVHVWWMKDGKMAAFDQHTNTLMLHRAMHGQPAVAKAA
jgi:hypothetical protein